MNQYIKPGRISAAPVKVPSSLTANLASDASKIEVSGSGKKIILELKPSVKVEINDGTIKIHALEEIAGSKALAGTYRSILSNAMTGLTEGWQKKLLFEGVGYKVMPGKRSNSIALHVGYSKPIEFEIPAELKFEIQDNNRTLLLISHDKQILGQISAEIRRQRPPNAYSGKGIRYSYEIVKKKEVGK